MSNFLNSTTSLILFQQTRKEFVKSRQDWVDHVSRDQVLEDLTHHIKQETRLHDACFTRKELASLRRNFELNCKIKDATQYWNPEILCTVFSHSLPPTTYLVLPLLFKATYYYTTYPFPPPSLNRAPKITFPALLHSLSLLTNRSSTLFSHPSTTASPRTSTERLRSLFQAVSSPRQPSSTTFSIPDVLNTLSVIQPSRPRTQPLSRGDLLPAATRLLQSFFPPSPQTTPLIGSPDSLTPPPLRLNTRPEPRVSFANAHALLLLATLLSEPLIPDSYHSTLDTKIDSLLSEYAVVDERSNDGLTWVAFEDCMSGWEVDVEVEVEVDLMGENGIGKRDSSGSEKGKRGSGGGVGFGKRKRKESLTTVREQRRVWVDVLAALEGLFDRVLLGADGATIVEV